MHRLTFITSFMLLFGPLVAAQEPEEFVIHRGLGDSIASAQQTEFMQMLLVILKKGAMMDGDDGWFKRRRSIGIYLQRRGRADSKCGRQQWQWNCRCACRRTCGSASHYGYRSDERKYSGALDGD